MDTLLLDGSEVRAVCWEPCESPERGTVCVAFAAASVRRDTASDSGTAGAGRDSVWGHLTGVTLRLSGVVRALDISASAWRPDGTLEDAIGALSGGEVRHAAQVWRALPLRVDLSEQVTLSLRFRAGPEWVWQGQHLSIDTGANSRFFESYAC